MQGSIFFCKEDGGMMKPQEGCNRTYHNKLVFSWSLTDFTVAKKRDINGEIQVSMMWCKGQYKGQSFCKEDGGLIKPQEECNRTYFQKFVFSWSPTAFAVAKKVGHNGLIQVSMQVSII